MGIAAVALALRLAWGALRGGERFFTEGYTLFFTLAGQLAAGYGYAFPGQPPTGFRVPLYPLFLAALTGDRVIGHCEDRRSAAIQDSIHGLWIAWLRSQ